MSKVWLGKITCPFISQVVFLHAFTFIYFVFWDYSRGILWPIFFYDLYTLIHA